MILLLYSFFKIISSLYICHIFLILGYIRSTSYQKEDISMELQRINEMLRKKEKVDIFYQDRPVWVQEVHPNNLATVGFIDNNEEKEIKITDLYEKQ